MNDKVGKPHSDHTQRRYADAHRRIVLESYDELVGACIGDAAFAELFADVLLGH